MAPLATQLHRPNAPSIFGSSTPRKRNSSPRIVLKIVHDEQAKEPPGAHQPIQQFLRLEYPAQAIPRRLGEEGKDRDPRLVEDEGPQGELPQDDRDQERDHPHPQLGGASPWDGG